jgi:hypothetical protein
VIGHCVSWCSYAIGFGPVTWLLLTEIFPARVRGTAMAACSSINWALSFVVTLTFLPTLHALGAGLLFVAYCFLWCVLPAGYRLQSNRNLQ